MAKVQTRSTRPFKQMPWAAANKLLTRARPRRSLTWGSAANVPSLADQILIPGRPRPTGREDHDRRAAAARRGNARRYGRAQGTWLRRRDRPDLDLRATAERCRAAGPGARQPP